MPSLLPCVRQSFSSQRAATEPQNQQAYQTPKHSPTNNEEPASAETKPKPLETALTSRRRKYKTAEGIDTQEKLALTKKVRGRRGSFILGPYPAGIGRGDVGMQNGTDRKNVSSEF